MNVKNCKVGKRNGFNSVVATNFAVTLFALLSKRKTETFNKHMAMHSDVMS